MKMLSHCVFIVLVSILHFIVCLQCLFKLISAFAYYFAHFPFKCTCFFLFYWSFFVRLYICVNHFCVYNKHIITRVLREYGLYPLVKNIFSLVRFAHSFEIFLTRGYNPYTLGTRVIIYKYII